MSRRAMMNFLYLILLLMFIPAPGATSTAQQQQQQGFPSLPPLQAAESHLGGYGFLPYPTPTYLPDPVSDCGLHSRGCFLGFLVGDAIGAPLYRTRYGDPNEIASKILSAMHMEGGGGLQVAPGQPIYPSEIAINVLLGLSGQNPRNGLPEEALATRHIEWYPCMHWEIGTTLEMAFGSTATDAASMRLAAREYSMASWSSAALMRIAPLAIWAHDRVETPELMDLARQETSMTNPDAVCQDANAVICVALASLLSWDEPYLPYRDVPATSNERAWTAIECVQAIIGDVHPTIQEWFADTNHIVLAQIYAFTNSGCMEWPFKLAFYFLRRVISFETAMRETCRRMGDCNTNAAIVGAMMGALYGSEGIPAGMSGPVLSFDCALPRWDLEDLGFTRPAAYTVSNVMAQLHRLRVVDPVPVQPQ